MGDSKAFLSVPRKEAGYRPIMDRVLDYGEIEQTLNTNDRKLQASRCMDCGVPFCNWACPLGNKAPEWNKAVAESDFELAYRLLNATNDFPEFTGRVCPALCEKACVLNLTFHEPTTNRENEAAITEIAFTENYVRVEKIERNGLKVAIIGAGPAGLVAANRLNHMGYSVSVYDKHAYAGGLLRYGIPNFKLNKSVIERRINILKAEGVDFHFGVEVDLKAVAEGIGIKIGESITSFDAYVVATGTPTARDLSVEGRDTEGVHLALELLGQQNMVLFGEDVSGRRLISCKGKDVLVIGGGDTGSDCIGTAHRQGCKSVTQIEIMPRPCEGPEDPQNPWPNFPRVFKTTSSHEEGCTRRWNINTLRFISQDGVLKGAEVQPIDWEKPQDGSRPRMVEAGPVELIKADVVFIAMGFLKPELAQSKENVFYAGDVLNGASLVVRAMASGRDAAKKVDEYLKAKIS